MKKFYVLERRVTRDRRKSPRQYINDDMIDRRRNQGAPPIIALADLTDPLRFPYPRLSTH